MFMFMYVWHRYLCMYGIDIYVYVWYRYFKKMMSENIIMNFSSFSIILQIYYMS